MVRREPGVCKGQNYIPEGRGQRQLGRQLLEQPTIGRGSHVEELNEGSGVVRLNLSHVGRQGSRVTASLVEVGEWRLGGAERRAGGLGDSAMTAGQDSQMLAQIVKRIAGPSEAALSQSEKTARRFCRPGERL